MGFSRQQYWSGVPLPSPKSGYKNNTGSCIFSNSFQNIISYKDVSCLGVWNFFLSFFLLYSDPKTVLLHIGCILLSPGAFKKD